MDVTMEVYNHITEQIWMQLQMADTKKIKIGVKLVSNWCQMAKKAFYKNFRNPATSINTGVAKIIR